MKRLILAFLLVFPLALHAQFFEFGPQVLRPQQQEQLVKAEFKGGKAGMNKFIEKNYKNPTPRNRDVSGEILVYCLISEKGKVLDTKVTRGLGPAYDNEAVRVVKKMKFKPAKQGKKKVKSRYQISFPIRKGRMTFNTLPTVEV